MRMGVLGVRSAWYTMCMEDAILHVGLTGQDLPCVSHEQEHTHYADTRKIKPS